MSKQAASCKGEGFKRVKLRKEGLKGLEKFEVGRHYHFNLNLNNLVFLLPLYAELF